MTLYLFMIIKKSLLCINAVLGKNKKQSTDVKMTLGDRSSYRKVKGNPLRSDKKAERHKKQWQWQFWKGKKE